MGEAGNSLEIEPARTGDEVVILGLQLLDVGLDTLVGLNLLIVGVTRMELVQDLSNHSSKLRLRHNCRLNTRSHHLNVAKLNYCLLDVGAVISAHKVDLMADAELVHNLGNLLNDIGRGVPFIEGAEAETEGFPGFSFVVEKMTRNSNERVPTHLVGPHVHCEMTSEGISEELFHQLLHDAVLLFDSSSDGPTTRNFYCWVNLVNKVLKCSGVGGMQSLTTVDKPFDVAVNDLIQSCRLGQLLL